MRGRSTGKQIPPRSSGKMPHHPLAVSQYSEIVAEGSSLIDNLQAELAGIVAFDNYKLTQITAELRLHNDRIANYVQGLPTRQEYDALHADVLALRDLVRAAGLRVA